MVYLFFMTDIGFPVKNCNCLQTALVASHWVLGPTLQINGHVDSGLVLGLMLALQKTLLF